MWCKFDVGVIIESIKVALSDDYFVMTAEDAYVGVEMAGITVSKTLVKWFRGKELALAMGIEMAVS